MHDTAVERGTAVHLQALIMDFTSDLRGFCSPDAAGLHDAVVSAADDDKICLLYTSDAADE